MGRSVKPSGVFDPPVGRTTSVVVLKRYISEGREDVRIVMSLSTQASTEVFEIEGRRGSLQFASENIFTDEVGTSYRAYCFRLNVGCIYDVFCSLHVANRSGIVVKTRVCGDFERECIAGVCGIRDYCWAFLGDRNNA